MRTTTGWLALLLTVGVALAPTSARAQDVPPEDPENPLPLYSLHPEKGGLYTAAEFLFWRQTNPLKHQEIAVRGLLDFDGSITAALNGTFVPTVPTVIPGQRVTGNFLGSKTPALFADQAAGPLSYEPGFRLTLGLKFASGVAVDVSWLSLVDVKYAASATLVPPTLNPTNDLVETFLFSPVFGFPNNFAGPANKIALGNPFAAFGIWDGASIMDINFIQRLSQYDINGRIPIFETDYCRCYGLVGFRYINMWERFGWTTIAEDFTGVAAPEDVAIYVNIVSNQMYGPTVGIGNEVYIGHGFSVSADLREATTIDFVREIVKYYRSDFSIQAKRSKKDYTIVPELDGQFNVWWYPTAGIQVRVGYDVMAFFNTVSSPDPVSFDFSGLDPAFKRTTRFIDGWNMGIGFIF